MEITGKQKRYFTEKLMDWHSTANDRSLPWKEEKDPYRIWLSEVILQQTRAQQGLPYYLRFTEAYPTVTDMASSNDEDIFRLWQGLGYYNRCKNMLATARIIANDLNGQFPKSYEELLKLKGIGPYTAAAIASFAFGLPTAVVDGNVYRVLARYFGIDTPFDTTEGKKQFQLLAQELIDTTHSAGYNQAIMDLGATVCTPQNPQCHVCPLQKNCVAYHRQLTTLLPVRSKRTTVRNRYFHYIVALTNDAVWIHKRTGKDIWENLHEFLLIEQTAPMDTKTLSESDAYIALGLPHTLLYEGSLKQRLTHQLIETRFYTLELKKQQNITGKDGKWVSKTALKNIAFPKTVVSFLEKNLYF